MIEKAIQNYEIDRELRFHDLFTSQEIIKLRPSAVMILMVELDHSWHVLLTHRSNNLVEHRGQVAFPGGAREPQDVDLEQTALRETHEEIGVKPEDVLVFGHLGDMPIVTGYLIRPYVGQMNWPYPLVLSRDEVQSAFFIPVEWLVNPKHRSIQYRSFAGREFPLVYFDEYEGHQLWGASAEITLCLLSALKLV